ncbi:MAG: double-strand break repair helicase AddA [Aestuariivirga sp.]
MSAAVEKTFIPTAKQKQAADPKHSVWVSANAGSGKTQVLVLRVIRLLLEGVEPASILCITYTKAAAAEMANRLYGQLASWTALSDDKLCETINNLGADGQSQIILTRARKLFTLALETPGGLKIQTIHAFCERLLHLFPVEAGLAPGFSLLEDRAADELKERAIAEVVYGPTGGDEIASAFESLSNRVNQEQFEEMLDDFIKGLLKSPPEVLAYSAEDFAKEIKNLADLPQTASYVEALREFTTIDRAAYAEFAKNLLEIPKSEKRIAWLKEIATADNPFDALCSFYFTKDLTLRDAIITDPAKKKFPRMAGFIDEQAPRLEALLTRLKTLELIEANAQAFTVASAVLRKIEIEKRKSGKVDFDDLIHRTAQLLSKSDNRDWVTFKLDANLSHILLDESQDTGPAQWLIIDHLVEEFFAGKGRDGVANRTLFVVGDDKQSIYSFQGADLNAFKTTREKYTSNDRLTHIPLDISYRSTDEVLKAVDKVHTEQTDPLKTLRNHFPSPARKNVPGIVEVWPLVSKIEPLEREPWDKPIDRPPQSSPKRVNARIIAQHVKDWTNPQQPRKLAGQNRAATAGDILILFRSRNANFSMVMAELRAAGVPVAGSDRLSLLQSLIVQDILALMNWLLLPQDDYTLACILKSPLVPEPLSEAQLFEAAHDRGSASLFSRLTGDNAKWLQRLTGIATSLPPDELLAFILNRCRKDISARLGPEALEASDAMLDMALSFQAEGGASLFAFVQWFQGTETTLKREMEKAGSEVRLMTVHGAKGLESPIVIIADAAQSPFGRRNKPLVLEFMPHAGVSLPLWFPTGVDIAATNLIALKEQAKDQTREESNRLLYVAMTRAQDELYVAGIGQGKKGEADGESWWIKLIETLGQPSRFGVENLFLAEAKGAAHGTTAALPDWLGVALPSEERLKPIGLNTAVSGKRTYDAAAAKRGRARHRLLQDLGDMPQADRAVYATKRASQLGLQDAEAQNLVAALAKPELAPYFGPDSRAEEEIWGTLEQTGQRVAGRLDRLAVRPEGLWLLDYKTGTAASPDHLKQMAGYAALLKQAFPGRPITAALFFTQTASLQQLSEAELTAALRESDAAIV